MYELLAEAKGLIFNCGQLNESANNLRKSCYYGLYNTHTDCPVSYGVLVTFATDVPNAPILQLASAQNADTYIRMRFAGAWNGWKKITTTDV